VEDLPKVYLDCRWCDLDYIREKVTFVNIVFDRFDSDIQVIQTRQRTGSGGREFSLIFIGRNEFSEISDTLKYFTNKTDTEETEREKFIKAFKLGLLRFLYKTPVANNFNISYEGAKRADVEKNINDEWDYWVFRSSLRSFLDGEKSQQFLYTWGSISASRVTEDWKIRFSLSGEYNESQFEFKNSKILNITRSQYLRTSVIKSLTAHWSAGVWLRATSSTFRNIDLSISAAPGIEYNIFPYSETNVRQLKFNYKLWADYSNYTDMTIYLKNSELLWQQKISAIFEIIKDWGNIGLGVGLSSYLHDLSKNSIELNAEVSLQIIKGLTLDISGGYDAVHDQLSLPFVNVSLEEVLLQRRELETQYSYRGMIGFSYTFGSIYNNIVNTRFDD
jgi:hypothetical protein